MKITCMRVWPSVVGQKMFGSSSLLRRTVAVAYFCIAIPIHTKLRSALSCAYERMPCLNVSRVTIPFVWLQVLTDQIREHRGVACRYIDPPFLLDGLKSDIRLYVLVTSFHPLVCYVYDEGLARFATELYSTADLQRRCMHLTNYSLNKHSQNFVRNTDEKEDDFGSKWSLSAFKRRLRTEIGDTRAAQVWEKVDDLIVKTIIAAEPTIHDAMKTYLPAAARGEPNRHCFQVFGFDVMLDADARPWLLEVSSLQSKCF